MTGTVMVAPTPFGGDGGVIPRSWLPVNLLQYARGDGTDEKARIQQAIDATPAFGTLNIPAGYTFVSSPGLTRSSPITIMSPYLGEIKMLGDTAGTLFAGTSDHIRLVQLKITGPQTTGAQTYVVNQKGVTLSGVYNGAGNAPTYISHCAIKDCVITNFGMYGIETFYTTYARITGNVVGHCTYTGLGYIASNYGIYADNTVLDIPQSTAPNSYGIFDSRVDADNDLIGNPRSYANQICDNNVSGVPNWDGINTHAGQTLLISGNVVTNCKKGIEVVGSNGTGGHQFAPLNVSVVGNTVDNCVGTGGIIFTGALGTGSLGNPEQYATGLITGNNVSNCGDQTSSGSGGIFCQYTQGLVISGNTINTCACQLISLTNDNKGIVINGNTGIDPWSNTSGICAFIYASSFFNTGQVHGNVLQRGTKAATTVASYGIRTAADASNVMAVGDNDFAIATTPYFAGAASTLTTTAVDGTATTTIAPAAGGAGALPATPRGYAAARVAGATQQIPYY